MPLTPVQLGTLHLDTTTPGWRTRVNPATLRLHDPYRCVLGQVYGSYLTGVAVLSGFRRPTTLHGDLWLALRLVCPWGRLSQWAVSCGFAVPGGWDADDPRWEGLRRGWCEEVASGVAVEDAELVTN